ncbi:GSU2403 family nucleotidyltransferase fold protein [Verrucomicrobiota bacterium]
MEKKKYSLCLEVLRRMKKEGILEKVMLVGSWCIFLYEDYFDEKTILPVLRTTDVEFLFPVPFDLERKTDLYELLKDLGFVLDYKGEQGYMIFQHPDLSLEFLAPARGRESDKPVPIEQLGINAQALRFMDALARNPIQMRFDDTTVTVPHPVDFALHKLLIAGRRKEKAKAEKDRSQATALLNALNDSGEIKTVRTVYCAMPNSWRKTIKKELLALGEEQLVELIEGT